MILYKEEKILVPNKLICDKCGKEITDVLEKQEAYSIHFIGGYASIFGDGIEVQCDLCQHCLKELIGKFCYIK